MLTARPTRETVLAKVRQIFPNDDPADILRILDLYGSEPHETERERTQLAILKLSQDNMDTLLDYVETAKPDNRDVIFPAEYPAFWEIGLVGVDKLDTESIGSLKERDLRQYLSWLQDTDEPDMSEYQEELQDED